MNLESSPPPRIDLVSQANMFKRQLLRQARVCRALRTSPSSLLALGSGAAPKPSTTYKSAILATSVSRQIIARAYSSASSAEQSENDGKPSGRLTRFADLASLGVHENIIRTIVDDMKYENMTDVQSMSINPALNGKDMYV